MILRARSIWPVSAPPIENGACHLENGRVKWLGRWGDLEAPPGVKRLDLGEVVLMPGLINAHCHLDYTNMAGQIPPPKAFPDWIQTILSLKAHWSFSDFAASWLKGARLLLDHGVTTVADTESVPELLPEAWKSTPLRVISFLEMTGVKRRRSPDDILRETLGWIDKLGKVDRKETGLSPHALYSTTPELIQKTARAAEERGLLLSIHLAESESEFQMFTEARGPFFEWLKGQRPAADCGTGSPVQLAARHGALADRTLAVHVNYLAPGDAGLLARSGASVVHCPRSHEYFGHDPFPAREFLEAGVNLCLGTDSLASTRKQGGKAPELNLWLDMRVFAGRHPGIAPKEILEMCTTRPAAALRKTGEIGSLKPAALADCIAVTYDGPISEKPLCERILFEGRVREVFIAGELARAV